MRAELALARDAPDVALRLITASLEVVERADGVRRFGGPLYAIGLRAAARLDAGERGTQATQLCRRMQAARDHAPRGIGPHWAAYTAMADAEWAALHGHADAHERWLRAEAALDALQLLPGATRARIRHAETLLPGEREHATKLLKQARRDATDAGLELLRADAEPAGRRANIHLTSHTTGPFALTPRELEVLRLVAQGPTPRSATNCSSAARRPACMSRTSCPSWGCAVAARRPPSPIARA